MSVVLGIDGGGTNTRAAIVADGKIVGSGQSGSIKKLRVGAEVAEANLRAVLKEAFAQAGVKGVDAACCGVASASSSSDERVGRSGARPLRGASATPSTTGAAICATCARPSATRPSPRTNKMLAVGLMSGTSLDGIDAALVSLHPRGEGYSTSSCASRRLRSRVRSSSGCWRRFRRTRRRRPKSRRSTPCSAKRSAPRPAP